MESRGCQTRKRAGTMPFDGTSKPSVGPRASQATMVLSMMEFFFDGGARWARRTFCTDDGKRCLLGALEYVRCETAHRDGRAVQYLARCGNWPKACRFWAIPNGDDHRVQRFLRAEFCRCCGHLERRQTARCDRLPLGHWPRYWAARQ